MRVTIHYLAQAKQVAGVASETVELAAGATAQQLVQRLAQQHGDSWRRLILDAAGHLQPSMLLFDDDVQVDWDQPHPLRDGSELTFLAPMSGG